MNKRDSEHQEHYVINAIQKVLASHSGCSIAFNDTVINNVVDVYKNDGHSELGKEKYADIILVTKPDKTAKTTNPAKKEIGLSMKMNSTPSILGGGLVGFKHISLEYTKKLMNKAHQAANEYSKNSEGSCDVPDVYVKISSERFLRNAFTGTKEMGGLVDYFVKGNKEPKFSIDGSTIRLDLKAYSCDDFIKEHSDNVYMRVRKRNDTGKMVFDENRKDDDGVPYIFSVPEKTLRARIVTTIGKPSKRSKAIIVD